MGRSPVGNADQASPRVRGAHAAAKSGRFRRGTPDASVPFVPESPSGRGASSGPGLPSVPEPRSVPMLPSMPSRPSGPPPMPSVPSVPSMPSVPEPRRPAPGDVVPSTRYGLLRAMRSAAADTAAPLVAAVLVPLAILQLPDGIAWAIPARFADAGPAAVTSLLRASGLALTAMAIAVPCGGLAVRRFRAWPVLIGGLGIVAAADGLGNTPQTIGQNGIDRAPPGA